jgi:putative cell wall-binding protein
VATGLNFPDALAGGAAAGRLGGPVLLVGSTVPASVLAELARLRPQRIIVLGGTSVVSAAVFTQLSNLAPAGATRIAGANRYATAAAASSELFAPETRVGAGTVFIATGLNYPDALAGAPLAGFFKAPILTVSPTALPAVTAAEIQRLDPAGVTILGGTASVSASVEAQLRALVPQVSRIAGADRYSTAAVIVARLESSPTATFVATGLNYPDALAGGAIAYGRTGWPILLTKPTSIPTPTQDQLNRLSSRRIWVLGGTSVVSDAVKNALAAYATGP